MGGDVGEGRLALVEPKQKRNELLLGQVLEVAISERHLEIRRLPAHDHAGEALTLTADADEQLFHEATDQQGRGRRRGPLAALEQDASAVGVVVVGARWRNEAWPLA